MIDCRDDACGDVWSLVCSCGNNSHSKTKEGVIDYWNRRVCDQTLQKDVAAINKAITPPIPIVWPEKKETIIPNCPTCSKKMSCVELACDLGFWECDNQDCSNKEKYAVGLDGALYNLEDAVMRSADQC